MEESIASIQSEPTQFGFSAFSLKLIAIAAMLIDHVGALFFPQFLWMRVIGRLTMPIMSYFIVVGYTHTRSFWRYFSRLLIAAAVSAVPFALAFHSWWKMGNVMGTLALGLLALWVQDHVKNKPLRTLSIIGLCLLSNFGDWGTFGVLLILSFSHAHKKGKPFGIYTYALFGLMFLIGLIDVFSPASRLSIFNRILLPFFYGGGFIALPLIAKYTGQRGRDARWLFYAFYPLHLIVLVVIREILT